MTAAVLLAAIVSVMCFTACRANKSSETSSSSASSSSEDKAANTTITEKDGEIGGKLEDGSYKMIKLYMDGEDSAGMIKTVNKSGVNMNLAVNGNQIKIMEINYTLKDGKFVGEKETITYAVDGSKVSVSDTDGSKMIFDK